MLIVVNLNPLEGSGPVKEPLEDQEELLLVDGELAVIYIHFLYYALPIE